jgi:ribosome biogenesis GTPase A
MSFIPRHVFPPLPSLPRSYFLGHHKSGLAKMKTLLTSIDLVVECRDYRVPLTSRNPLFEHALEGTPRIVVYTKRDLGGGVRDQRNEDIVRKWHGDTKTIFVRNGHLRGDTEGDEHAGRKSVGKLLEVLREHASRQWKLVGHRVMIVGMPNVGKSTLLNALRAQGIGKGKVARTGAQPGVTRKISGGVKIVPSEDDDDGRGNGRGNLKGVGGGVYLLDTPGVFIPYVPDAHAMMKLALCGSVKDTIIAPVMLADYLLYHLNLHSPTLYAEYCSPTNEIMDLLSAIATKTGRLGKGGAIDTEATSLWVIQKWRNGLMGRFGLDELGEDALVKYKLGEEVAQPSFNQARRVERERRRERNKMRGMKE